ncbi:MAG: heme ABC transporter ATP-binding protein [Pseudomonadota bacterium]
MLSLVSVSVSLSKKQIVRDISLNAKAGDVTAIVGPNGSGKTTLLRAVTGEVDYNGSITINGDEVRKLSPMEQASRRGVLPQSSVVAFPFTVLEVVGLGRKNAVGKRPLKDVMKGALEEVGLQDFGPRIYNELSGGEQQRVQLARVLFQIGTATDSDNPKWLLLDEPVSSLDIRHQLLIMNKSSEFAARGGGVVAIMHDLNLTAMFADQMCMLRQGEVVAVGPPADVFTSLNVRRVFDCDLKVGVVPSAQEPFVLPQSARS